MKLTSYKQSRVAFGVSVERSNAVRLHGCSGAGRWAECVRGRVEVELTGYKRSTVSSCGVPCKAIVKAVGHATIGRLGVAMGSPCKT